MVANQKRRKTKTQLLNQTKWNRIRNVRLPNTLPDISHHTPCHSNHNVQSPPDFDAEWHSYSHVWDLVDTIVFLGGWMENERKGGKQNEFELMTQHIGLVIVNSLVGMKSEWEKSDERGEKERKKVVVKFMIDSLLSFIRKEMKTRTIKLVTLNPTRIVDNAQSELIVVFFPPSLLRLAWTRLNGHQTPHLISCPPLLLHRSSSSSEQKVKNNELLIFISCKTIAYRQHSFVPKDMSADGYWEEDGKNTANANTPALFISLVRRIPPNHIMLLLR
ncbi:hypothetical protein BLNAU_21767 [Blattamonas nauphoetae]|uniref:Uncharacterized protein n=1 Tax=Blattamonas nauphoetae TaxID=2049346 RepID=A0ABQ9WV30_9EUKA|nr:hypothetical protein BLNAU_21767 [Blattamonas nauphoetae]